MYIYAAMKGLFSFVLGCAIGIFVRNKILSLIKNYPVKKIELKKKDTNKRDTKCGEDDGKYIMLVEGLENGCGKRYIASFGLIANMFYQMNISHMHDMHGKLCSKNDYLYNLKTHRAIAITHDAYDKKCRYLTSALGMPNVLACIILDYVWGTLGLGSPNYKM